MLKSVIICTAIATFAIIPAAKAQYPYPGGPLVNHCAEDPQCAYQHRDDWGDAYGTNERYGFHSHDNVPGNSYQPYPSVSPSIRPLEDYGIGSRHRGLYGDDD